MPELIPITSVRFGREEESAVLEVLRSGMVAQGPRVAALEEAFAELCGVRHAIAVNNGTTSLVASLQALDLEEGDEVVTSPFTFVATLNAILEAGATAVFADVEETTFTLDPTRAAEAVTDRTRVVAPVHLYGQPADMTAIGALADQRGLAVLEDAAQAHGARHRGRPVGSFGIGSFSFYATKNITTGEGGIITTDDDALAEKLRIMRNQGMRARYEYVMAGHNYRMTDLQAALALPQLARYEQTVSTRRRHAEWLSAALADVPGLVVPSVRVGDDHVWHQYTVRIETGAHRDRAGVTEVLAERGVGFGVYYPRNVYDYPVYREHPRVHVDDSLLEVSARVAGEALSLPVHEHLTSSDLDRIASAVREALA